ncbi:MAG: transposase [Magnetovibrio sp.]|nr:transposase [Magnetovibrio sp.]
MGLCPRRSPWGRRRARANFSPEFKARVALAAFRGGLTIQDIVSRHKLHPGQVSTWTRQEMDGFQAKLIPTSHIPTSQNHNKSVLNNVLVVWSIHKNAPFLTIKRVMCVYVARILHLQSVFLDYRDVPYIPYIL